MGLRDDDWFGHSLVKAASLIGETPEQLKTSPVSNIRGGAAVLASLADDERAANDLQHSAAFTVQTAGNSDLVAQRITLSSTTPAAGASFTANRAVIGAASNGNRGTVASGSSGRSGLGDMGG